jgi:hypothetical protein
MKNPIINKLFRYAVISGNAVYILWITYNGIDEGFSGTMVQKVSYVGLLILLVLNIILVYRG